MTENKIATASESNENSSFNLWTLWRDIIEAVKGSEQDFTSGSIGRAILLLSIPMVLEMMMESVFAVVDIFFVSKLGADAVATVGLTESMLTIVYAISIGLSLATTAIVSRRIGEKNHEGAAAATVQAILTGILVSVFIAVPGIFFAPDLLRLMGATQEIIDSGFVFTSIMIGSNVIIMLLFIINAVFRGAGDAAYAMRILWIANLINIVLDPCLILGLGPFPELGVTGAAVATAIGRGTAVIFQFILLLKRSGRIKIHREQIRFDFSVMKRLLRLSLGGIGQFLIATSSWIGLMRIMAVFGSESLAGYTIAIRILVFSILPSWGMSNAAATLVGQNLGAKKPKRAERSVWVSAIINMVFLCGIALVFITYPEFLIRLFTNEKKIVEIGAQCLRFLSFGYPFYAFGMVMTQAFNGAGDTTTPTILNFFCFWLIEVPLAYMLALQFGLAETGVFLAIISSESLLGILGIIVFRQGRWKLREV
ncbi:MAG: MATE family efflux transporter [Calditrichia bacterium]|jgi:putative MATE family efflux protein|nr:MATE family efflux transporter [Calditrichia bacterium]